MNKFLVLTALAACTFAIASAEKTSPPGSFTPIEFDPVAHKDIWNLSVSKIESVDFSQSVPKLQGFYSQVVSGVLYKLIIQYGVKTYEIRVWSQPWENLLEVSLFKDVTNQS